MKASKKGRVIVVRNRTEHEAGGNGSCDCKELRVANGIQKKRVIEKIDGGTESRGPSLAICGAWLNGYGGSLTPEGTPRGGG